VRVLGRIPPLLVAEDEIDPRVQMERHVFALERQTIDANELGAAVVRPGGEGHVADHLTVLLDAEVVAWEGEGEREEVEHRAAQRQTVHAKKRRVGIAIVCEQRANKWQHRRAIQFVSLPAVIRCPHR